MTTVIRPQKPSDETSGGGTKWADGKLPKGGFRGVSTFDLGSGTKKSPTTCEVNKSYPMWCDKK